MPGLIEDSQIYVRLLWLAHHVTSGTLHCTLILLKKKKPKKQKCVILTVLSPYKSNQDVMQDAFLTRLNKIDSHTFLFTGL